MDKRMIVVAIGSSIVSLAAGAAGGYLFAKRRLEDSFNEQMEEEIEATKKFYNMLHKKGEFETPSAAVKALIPEPKGGFSKDNETLTRVLTGLKYMDESKTVLDGTPPAHLRAIRGDEPKIETLNIFDTTKDVTGIEFDLEAELANRDPNSPYILLKDEFMRNEHDWRQMTLTYFAGDNVLVNESEEPLDDPEKFVGEANYKFGFMSDDPNVVYIRNEGMEVEFEVLLSRRKYTEEVLGVTDDGD